MGPGFRSGPHRCGPQGRQGQGRVAAGRSGPTVPFLSRPVPYLL